ncbi:MAG: cytochrome c oxidase subunit 3 [Gemmatimonadota bacterium]
MTIAKMNPDSSPARTGVWIGIATITMSFAAYTSALMVRQGSGADWQHIDLPKILYVNTLVLLLSSVTIEVGRRRLTAGWLPAGRQDLPASSTSASGMVWLAAALALGLLFVAGQVLAWRSLSAQGLFLASSPGSSFFYVFTVLHALHLLGGIAALGYVINRLGARRRGAPPRSALGAVTLYWHFMDVLWIYLLLLLALRL